MKEDKQYSPRGRLLAIDTSTSSMTVALLEGSRMLESVRMVAERNHSQHLVPAIRNLFEAYGWKAADLEAVAVGRGPGSYTGVRIGVTVAKTLAWTNGSRLLGISSLEAAALGGCRTLEAQNGGSIGRLWVVPLVNARRGQAFTGLFERVNQSKLSVSTQQRPAGPPGGEEASAAEDQGSENILNGWRTLVPDGIRLVDRWVEELLDRAKGEVRPPEMIAFVGETEGFQETIEKAAESWDGHVRIFHHETDARDIGLLGVRDWIQGKSENVHAFVPNYAQLPEAEAKLMGKAGGGR